MSYKIRSRHLGRFDISISMLDKYPEKVLKLMGKIIITRAECIYLEDCIRYVGISKELFDYVDLAEIIPKYQITLIDNKIYADKIGDV